MAYQNHYPEAHELHPQSLPVQEFLGRVQDTRTKISTLADDIEQIANLHQRAVSSTTPNDPVHQQLEQLVSSTQQKTAAVSNVILYLKSDAEKTSETNDFNTKKKHVESMNADFKREVQRYMSEEQRYKSLCRDQIARQYRIVNPDATEEEVRGAANRNWGDEGVFQIAVCLQP